MLELKNIKKTYNVSGIETRALDDISVSFRQKEFVAILGISGSGKTTCLNMIGGLDRYDSGDMTIKGKHTYDFKDSDWDAYRNNSVGFVFQSYNIIMHLSIVANVALGMTLSGVSSAEKTKRALDVLNQVGLSEHIHKKPNQLSGGQMQRVAIARALANDPEILLCDEPTGALDSTTSKQIMDLIKEVAKDRLVIMVTHNPDIAKSYADRIINFEDGKIISDSNPHIVAPKPDQFKLKKTSMSFFTALRLSFNNIKSKKGRTFLTSFASSIGIIGIAIILSLSTGFKSQIDIFQRDALSEFPIVISKSAMSMDKETIDEMKSEMAKSPEFPDSKKIILYDPSENHFVHNNVFTDEYLKYIGEIDPEICGSIGVTRIVSMNMVRKIDDNVVPVSWKTKPSNNSAPLNNMGNAGLSSYPEVLKEGEESYLIKNYDLLEGEYPKNKTDLVLVVDPRNRVDFSILKNLGFETEDIDSINFEDIVGTQLKIISNNDYYTKTELGSYIPSSDFNTMYNSKNSINITITAIVRQKESVKIPLLSPGIAYSDELSGLVIDSAMGSNIVADQKNSEKNVITMREFTTPEEKDMTLASLGGDSTPFMVLVFPENFENKDEVLAYLDAFNNGKDREDMVLYTDLASTMSSMTGGIMDGITIVLIAFAGISLVVSLIMIAIITYTSVLERTKEIGILRSLGARKKDITRVFDAETCILGVFSGLLGVGVAYLSTFPINRLLLNLTELENVATLKLTHAIILVIISTVLTILGGHIPAKMASKKDTVEALRTE